MGKMRNKLETILHATEYRVGSNGLGGDIYVLRSQEDPVRVAHLTPSDVCDDIHVDLETAALPEFGLEAHADALIDAAKVALRRPF